MSSIRRIMSKTKKKSVSISDSSKENQSPPLGSNDSAGISSAAEISAFCQAMAAMRSGDLNGNHTNGHRTSGTSTNANGHRPAEASGNGVDLAEKIKELVRLAQEQGYLTYGDINDALPDTPLSAEDLD